MTQDERDAKVGEEIIKELESVDKMLKDPFYDTLKWLLSCHSVAGDLWQTFGQKTKTSKYYRRERALAYILENFTGELFGGTMPHEQARIVWDMANALKKRSDSQEVIVACDRIMTRMSRNLSEPEIGGDWCVACGKRIERDAVGGHHCDPKDIGRKDAAMMKDDKVQEIS